MVRLKGFEFSQAVVAMWIVEVDEMTGGKTEPTVIEKMAALAIDHMKHRSVASIMIALREGMAYTDADGKVYGALTWPKLKLWLDRHEEAIMNKVAGEHSATVVKNDNLGRDWLDRQEQGDPRERLIEQLKRKLATIERKKK